MTTSPELEFQKVLFSNLSTPLAPAKVYAGAPPSCALPYVDISESESVDHPAGEEITTVLHIWSRVEGPHEAKDMGRKIRAVIVGNNFTSAEWTFVNVRVDDSRTFLDPDGQTWHSVLRIRAVAST